MATQSIAGYNGVMSISLDGGTTWLLFGELLKYSLKWVHDMIKATSHSSAGSHEFIPGNSGWSATFDGLYIYPDVGQAAVETARSGVLLKIRFDPYGEGTGKPRYTGSGYIENWGQDSPVEDNNAVTGGVRGTGLLVESTQA